MKYKIVKENKPTLSTYGKYKAKTVHNREVDSRTILRETASRLGVSEGTVTAVVTGLSEIINAHLRHGDKVRLDNWGLMKLEITSEHVDSPAAFKPRRHIRGVRLHLLPESTKGRPELYQGITYEKVKEQE